LVTILRKGEEIRERKHRRGGEKGREIRLKEPAGETDTFYPETVRSLTSCIYEKEVSPSPLNNTLGIERG